MKTLAVILNDELVRIWNVSDEDAAILMSGTPIFQEGAE